MTKRKYLQKLNGKIVNKSTKPHNNNSGGVIIDQPQGQGKQGVSPISTSQSHNLSSPRAPGGSANPTTYKLTEEVLEDAIVRVLQTDPAKGLGPAISFMDKKKSLSVEDADTDRSIIALEKLERKRKEMFYTE